MSFVYEVAISGTLATVPIAHVYHVYDGDESESPDDVADVFENDHIPDMVGQQVDTLTWTRIGVTPLDVDNFASPVNRVINEVGELVQAPLQTGSHLWAKFISDDNGFKSGGKLWLGLTEDALVDGKLTAAYLALVQTIYDALIADLIVAGMNLCIYRPSLSTPGFPSISICSVVLVRGIGSNNRRQEAYTF